jgi:hypothetical protein
MSHHVGNYTYIYIYILVPAVVITPAGTPPPPHPTINYSVLYTPCETWTISFKKCDRPDENVGAMWHHKQRPQPPSLPLTTWRSERGGGGAGGLRWPESIRGILGSAEQQSLSSLLPDRSRRNDDDELVFSRDKKLAFRNKLSLNNRVSGIIPF